MSFYFDEESQSHQGGEEGFVCANCGGTSSYPDSNTGALCCDSCFTQSQVLPDTELEFEEVQALAARTSFGRVIGTTAARRNKGGGAGCGGGGGGVTTRSTRSKTPLDEYDTSTPFPNLITCLHGMQQVMKHCVELLNDLVGLESSHPVDTTTTTTVRSLWRSYLRAWADGAEYYGTLHPEIRFSLRDAFLPAAHKTKIMKHLSHRVACAVREGEEEEKKDDSEEGTSAARARIVREPQNEKDDEGVRQDSNLTKEHERTIAHFRKSYHRPKSLMWLYWNKGKRGRLEAALMIAPSMRLVVGLLWLGVSRDGVTLHQILTWISNGALPLQNAFHHCLSEQEQAVLRNVSTFFRMTKLPTVTEMENLVGKLVVACGLKSFSNLHGMPSAPKETPDKAVRVTKSKGGPYSKHAAPQRRPDFSYVTPASVPRLTARLMEDLGLDHQILLRSLALMGIVTNAPANMWLPAPLPGARPEHLWSTAHVLAVIVVACKMTPGWETWTYPPSPRPRKEEEEEEDDDDPARHADEHVVDGPAEDERAAKRRRTESIKNRFVPYNEENFRLVTNGPRVEGYLDYLEDHILDEKEAIFPNFRLLLHTNVAKEVAASDDGTKKDVVVRRQEQQQPVVRKESRDPFGRNRRIWKRQKFHEWHVRLGTKRARWTDANGLGEYVIYNMEHHSKASSVRDDGRTQTPRTPEPFHPQYGLLIEYLSHKANVMPSKIHAVVAALDQEVMHLVVRP